MPIYDWSCKKCGTAVPVIRSFAEYEVPPSDEEVRDAPVCNEGTAHVFVRVIGGKQTVLKGPNWGWGKKGSW